jgi:hypothetical protein
MKCEYKAKIFVTGVDGRFARPGTTRGLQTELEFCHPLVPIGWRTRWAGCFVCGTFRI